LHRHALTPNIALQDFRCVISFADLLRPKRLGLLSKDSLFDCMPPCLHVMTASEPTEDALFGLDGNLQQNTLENGA